VLEKAGYCQIHKFISRLGASRLSLEKVVKALQSNFSINDWYYLRKIHKKESNYFLNKGGMRGSSGGGWLSRKSVSDTKSNQADEDIKLTLKQKQRLKRTPKTPKEIKTDSTSEVSSQHSLSSLQQQKPLPFNMIDEEDLSQEEADEPKSKYKREHIELKDLTEDRFLELTESKNQARRFYSWLNFQPLF
jgi:hypothetical protein